MYYVIVCGFVYYIGYIDYVLKYCYDKIVDKYKCL